MRTAALLMMVYGATYIDYKLFPAPFPFLQYYDLGHTSRSLFNIELPIHGIAQDVCLAWRRSTSAAVLCVTNDVPFRKLLTLRHEWVCNLYESKHFRQYGKFYESWIMGAKFVNSKALLWDVEHALLYDIMYETTDDTSDRTIRSIEKAVEHLVNIGCEVCCGQDFQWIATL